MSNNIKLICHSEDGKKICEQATFAIRSISKSISFDFESVFISPNELQNPTDDVFEKLKCGDALLFCGFDQKDRIDANFLLAIQKKFNLYATSQHYRNLTLVYDGFGGIYHGKKGFNTNKTFGREAYDIASYGELEVERTARIAYEIAENSNRKLLLADRADSLATSALWRKAVVDINEDYPFVNIDCKYVEDTICDILNLKWNGDMSTASINDTPSDDIHSGIFGCGPCEDSDIRGVVLTSNMYGTLLDTICKSTLDFEYAMFAGDTPFAGFVCNENTPLTAYKNMLEFSFGEI